jgi:predicted transport protein
VTDLKLFRIDDGRASELTSRSFALERNLQTLIEANMETTFGVRFLATEYTTGKVHRGRIDSLGLDENGSPVIFEYKRTSNENVINQGLFYLDWLMDHKGEFQILVASRLGAATAESIEWSAPRLICVANDFTRYDEYAVRQIDRNVELVRYRDFGPDLLAIELVTSVSTETTATTRKPLPIGLSAPAPGVPGKKSSRSKTVSELLAQADPELAALYEKFETFALSLGDDVVKNERSLYFAFRRLKNFACVEVHPTSKNLLVYLKLDPASVEFIEGFSRDVSKIGHFGTGDLELRIGNTANWPLVEELTRQAYAAN